MQSYLTGTVILEQAEIKTLLPGLGSCLLIWARPILGDFYEASFSTQDSGYTLWLVKIYNGLITPIKCSLYFVQQEYSRILLAEQLKLDSAFIKENIFLSWIKEFKDAAANRK